MNIFIAVNLRWRLPSCLWGVGGANESLWSLFSGVTEALGSLPAQPIEFALLGHTPSLPYTLFDVAAVSTIYSIMLNRGLTRDFVRVHLKGTLGEKWKVIVVKGWAKGTGVPG